jgi:membrane protease YdiL (CAAX protease family)
LGRWYALPLALAVTIFLEGGALEEPGWRGFALPQLLGRRSALSASLILGAVHAGWHLPLYVTSPENLYYIPLVMAAAVLFTWLYVATRGSVLLAVLFHGSVNTFAAYFAPLFPAVDAVRLFWLLAALLSLAAIVVVALTGRHLSLAQPRRPSLPAVAVLQPEPIA